MTTEAPLFFERLSPDAFERLCLALLSAEGHTRIRHWGAAGSEDGCDLISRDGGGRVVVTQCKRVGKLTPAGAEKELRKVLDKPPRPAPEIWALAATRALSRKLEERLVKVAAGKLEIELSGLSELDRRVREHPELVAEFFGPATASAAAPAWWVSAAGVDRGWAGPFAEDLRTCLQQVRPGATVELAIPSKVTPWPAPPPNARWGLVVVTPEALADSRLRQIWRDALRQPCDVGGPRRLLALSLEPAPWPGWLEDRFERVDLGDGAGRYRVDLATIVSKYIGETEKNLPASLEGPGARPRRVPAALRSRLVSWLEPLMGGVLKRQAIVSLLRLEPHTVLDDFETPALRASASLVLATAGDDPVEAALRVTSVLRQKLSEEESEDRLKSLDAIATELSELRAAIPERDDLLTAWLQQVVSDHSRLVDHFQQHHELALLDRVYVELEMAPDRFAETVEHREGGEMNPRHGYTLQELVGLDPEEHSWATRRWLVRGDPGSGKTTLLRHLAAKLAGERPPSFVPVFQSLPVLIRDGRPFLERLERALGRAERRGLGRVLDRAGEEGRLAVLLDGLDEVGAEEREDAETLIRQLADRWPETPIVVTTRPIGYRRFAGGFRELVLQPLDRERRREFLARWFGRFDGTRDEGRAEEALGELEGPGFEDLTGNPLYLTLMALLLEDGTSPAHNRAALYDQIFELLLEGKQKLGLRDGSFEPIARPALVRRGLRRLAETMTVDNRDAEPRRQLEERLYRDELAGVLEEMRKVPRWDRNPRRFLDDLAEKAGILGPHDGEAADWRFWHRTFREALTAERMAQWPADRLDEHARGVEGQESRWAEPYALLCGQVGDADALLRRLLGVNRSLALRALATAQKVSDATVEEILELTGEWRERSKVYGKLPELAGDADRCLRLIERLRQRSSDVHDLFFLEESARRVAARWPESARAVEAVRSRFFADRDPPPEELFSRVETLDGPVALWREIAGGTFLMGSPESEGDYDEKKNPLGGFNFERPQHKVRITGPLRMMVVPVTQAMYRSFDPSHELKLWEGVDEGELGDHPVVNVDWYGAAAFCRWLRRHGFPDARLPTEAEWEFSCRAGTATRFWSGDGEEELERIAWYGANASSRTHRVGEKPSNLWGLYDMHGNVWEWCADVFDAEAYAGRAEKQPATDPAADEDVWNTTAVRVLRGGAWGYPPRDLRAAYRGGFRHRSRHPHIGFRLVCGSGPEHLDS